MVQLRKSANLHSHLVAEPETTMRGDKVPVKLEIVEDPQEDEHEPNNKRSKPSPAPQQQWSSGPESFPIAPAQYNPLGEPSPLGLSLRKSPSLLDLIQMRLSGGSASALGAVQNQDLKGAAKKEGKGTTSSSASDKLKASNFHASILRIGSWEYKSRHEGDLVGKCYFAKHKLVWEVLEGGLKSKIEIQWSDITALRANCPDDAPGTLNVVLARQPLFFKEINPQPRKHTLWQATSDFTDGQASTHRQHFLQCAQGLLNKHFEKLLQCDMRLNFLSRQPEIILNSPYFESRASVFEDLHGFEGHEFNQVENFKGSSSSGFLDLASPSAAQSSSLEMEKVEHPGLILEQVSREAPSPSSGMDTRGIEGGGNCEVVDSKRPSNWDQIKAPGLHLSMSMSDLVNHIGHCISEQMGSRNLPLSDSGSQGMLEDMAQYLLSDAPLTTPDDEKCLMSRVNSLCCLLQKDPSLAQTSQFNGASFTEESSEKTDVQLNHGDVKESEKGVKDVSLSKQTTTMSRKLFWRSAASSSSNCISSKILI